MGERRSVTGKRRIVSLRVDLGTNRSIGSPEFDGIILGVDGYVLKPATYAGNPEVVATVPAFSHDFPGAHSCRALVGTSDPHDDSHVTVGVMVDGRRETFDLWLQDDDSLRYQMRRAGQP